LLFVTTAAFTAIRCSTAWQHAAKLAWARLAKGSGGVAVGMARRGWFFGLKLHFVINHKGQVMALKITPGNIADSTVLDQLTRQLTGKLYADKGYIGYQLFQTLWQRSLHLITGIGRNMKNYLAPRRLKWMPAV
jgi:IS5 family transposase